MINIKVNIVLNDLIELSLIGSYEEWNKLTQQEKTDLIMERIDMNDVRLNAEVEEIEIVEVSEV